MSKTKKRFASNRWADEYEDAEYENDYKEAKTRRQQKRVANILRSKNVDQLIDIEERDNER